MPVAHELVDESDHVLAHDLAELAAARLVELRAELFAQELPAVEVKDRGDRSAHDYLVARLAEERPHDAVLSEESGVEDPAVVADRLAARRVWIVDPLDGTREFGEGRHDWAVHVALAVDGRPVVGAVAVGAEQVTLATLSPPAVPASAPPVVVASRSRPPRWAAAAAAAVGAEIVPLGSAGYKAMAVVRGDALAYVHAGGMSEWDSCAPVAVALAAGLWVSDLAGEPLAFNTPAQSTPELVICRPGLEGAILSAARSER